MANLDPRLLRISVEVNGKLKTYEGLEMSAGGTKFANANQNECEIKINNLDKATRDYLLTETSPFNKNKSRKILRVEAGRVSTGYSLVFQGDITNASVGQPPDITLTLKSAALEHAKGKVVAKSHPGITPMRNIAAGVAKDLGLSLNFQADPKQVSNYTHTGAAAKQVNTLGTLGRVNAYEDNGALVVKNWNTPLAGRMQEVNLDTGMIGIPEFTEKGIKVKILFDNRTVLGGALRITSRLNPAANGVYVINLLEFSLTSRDTPWYYDASATRVGAP